MFIFFRIIFPAFFSQFLTQYFQFFLGLQEFVPGFSPGVPATALNLFLLFPTIQSLFAFQSQLLYLNCALWRRSLLLGASILLQGFGWTYQPPQYFFQNQIVSVAPVHVHFSVDQATISCHPNDALANSVFSRSNSRFCNMRSSFVSSSVNLTFRVKEHFLPIPLSAPLLLKKILQVSFFFLQKIHTLTNKVFFTFFVS